jgi:hypothetical protein
MGREGVRDLRLECGRAAERSGRKLADASRPCGRCELQVARPLERGSGTHFGARARDRGERFGDGE